MQPDRQVRHIRVERVENHIVEDDTAYLWAVSYADFLMVLMSFFVLFFSVNPENRPDLLMQVAQAISPKATGSGNGAATDKGMLGAGAGAGAGGFGMPGTMLATQLKDRLARFNLTIESEHDRVFVRMLPGMFEKNAFRLQKEAAESLDSIFSVLLPFKDRIRVTVIGHTDSRPLKGKLFNGWIEDNFDLSVQRALQGLKRARVAGFPQGALAAQGSAEYQVDGRSLTLMIEGVQEVKK